jgi:hypothetical protein
MSYFATLISHVFASTVLSCCRAIILLYVGVARVGQTT